MKPLYRNSTVSLLAVAAVIVAVFTAASAEGGLVFVDKGSDLDGNIDATAGGKTIQIEAGSTADLLVVGTSTEFGGGDSFTAKYDGNAMTLASGNEKQSNLFYLDLTPTTYSGGSKNLVFSWDNTAGGDLGVGWASAKVDGGLQAGESIALHNTGSSDDSSSVDLTTTVDGTFNFVNFNANQDGGSCSMDSSLTQIYLNQSFGSTGGGAGYEANVNKGTHTYSWSGLADRRIDAAAFTVIPEPVTIGVLGLGAGLLLLIRRKLTE